MNEHINMNMDSTIAGSLVLLFKVHYFFYHIIEVYEIQKITIKMLKQTVLVIFHSKL
jgi:hypothetical protein